jgi:hypothetical protein
MRVGQHAARDILGFEAVLQKNTRRVVGALGGAANDEDFAVAGELAEPRTGAPRRRPLDLRKMSFNPSILAPG